MNRRRFILGMGSVSIGGSALVASGTGAFSRVESQREVRIQPADDEDAYLGIRVTDADVDCEGTVTLVTLTNQLKQNTILSFERLLGAEEFDELSADVDITLAPGQEGTTFDVGEEIDLRIDVRCDPGTDENVVIQFGVEVVGTDSETDSEIVEISAQPVEEDVPGKNRTIDVHCLCEQDTSGLSFIAFCGDLTADEITFDYRFDDENELEGISWELADGLGGQLKKVVLYGGGLDQGTDGNQEFLNYDVGDEESGAAIIGEQNETIPRNHPEETTTGQTPQCPCGEPGSGVKFNIDDSGTIKKIEEFDCS